MAPHPIENPFEKPLVVRTILGYVPMADLRQFRLVSTKWNKEALHLLKQKQIVVMRYPPDFLLYNQSVRGGHGHFEICTPDITNKIDQHIQTFWEIQGPTMQCLHLRHSELYWGDVNNITRFIPRLAKLCLHSLPKILGRNYEDDENGAQDISSVRQICLESFPVSKTIAVGRLRLLLSALPNLQEIVFLSIPDTALERDVSTVVLNSFQSPRVILRDLHKIETKLYLNNEDLDLLTTKRFPLIHLDATLKDGITFASFNALLRFLRRHLISLTISFDNLAQSIVLFPAFQQLQTLERLKLFNCSGDLFFLETMPRLLRVEVDFGSSYTPERRHGVRRIPYFQHEVEEIQISARTTISIEGIQFMCGGFHSLRVLQIPGVTDTGMGLMYRNLPHLHTLHLICSQLTDYGITGVRNETGTDLKETGVILQAQSASYRTDLYIGCLQRLRELKIEGSTITDTSIYLGLSECDRLEKLYIKSPNISDCGLIQLSSSLVRNLDILDVTGCTGITEFGLHHARVKMGSKIIDARSRLDDLHLDNRQKRVVANLRDYVRDPTGTNAAATQKFQNLRKEFTMQRDEMRVRELPYAIEVQHPELNEQNTIRRIRRAYSRNGNFMAAMQLRVQTAGERRENGGQFDVDDLIPEIYLAELFKLGLVTNDILFWMNGFF